MDLLVTCSCGHRMAVSEFAMGMTSQCPACKQPLTVSPKNAQPIESRREMPPADPTPAQPSETPQDIQYTPIQTSSLKTHCARCGREFRGDWDRHQSSMGLLCNICSNLVRQQTPLQPSGYVQPVDSMKLEPEIDPVPLKPVEVEEVELTWRDKYWPDEEMIRRIAIGAAVAFMLYTVYLLISGAWIVEDPEGGDTVTETTITEIPELPRWAVIAMKLLGAGSGMISSVAGIYIFLTLSHRLPEESFLANIIKILPAAAIITAIYLAASFLPVPFINVIVTIVFVPAIIFINFGLEGQDVINFPVGMILGGILQFLFFLLIYWAIGAVAL